ncbi:hypothetical protein K490DRAFT_75051 [Saccharata proteae CBS 121410]|uniref:Amine oxidase domain-containing protein n=1 Tax=Saccharata proteae CBS 121410 TaxID=1314787 RepID=A0A9P4HU61_9PEZI|nr:hypothetical protein K490DRAFT_75051 [Saccharata proteae CBS 121410]
MTLLIIAGNAILSSSSITFQGPFEAEANGMHNVHVSYSRPIDGELSIYYGSCQSMTFKDAHHRVGKIHVGVHPLAPRHTGWKDNRPSKFVWLPPSDTPSGGCLHAFVGETWVGSSEEYQIKKRKARRSIAFADIADAEGPWFDGVEYLKEKEPSETFVAQSKSKTVGILGGGMSGLMTAFLLESVGMHDWKILEASSRIGGRVHTSYLNGTTPDDYQYQEMGPMRFPVSVTNTTTNETIQILDHRMVFQLADALNKMNGNDSTLAVNFIKWIQSSANQPYDTSKRRPDGTEPGAAEVEANPSLADNTTATYSNATAVAEAEAAYDKWINFDWEYMRELGSNVFEAHKKAVAEGYFDFSESQYLRYVMGTNLNVTDEVDSTADFFPTWLYDNLYFEATDWRTIDKGLSRLPEAFGPLVYNRTRFHTKIEALSWDASAEKMTVSWRPTGEPWADASSATFDYAVVAVPFSKVRIWDLPPYSSLLSRAINTLNYDQSCKVALHYETRFWEHLEYPIIGGCGSTNIAGVGSICYPSYKLNSSGPGVILASYESNTMARTLGSMTEAEHVAYVQRAMVAVHGQVAADQWTGNYDRICWELNEFQAGAWCDPLVGQQELYLPAYFNTEMHTVFVGEHTSFTHAWIWSALESAVRGTTQLLLDMGLVDEAKAVTETWMARWIHV